MPFLSEPPRKQRCQKWFVSPVGKEKKNARHTGEGERENIMLSNPQEEKGGGKANRPPFVTTVKKRSL